MTHWRAVLVCFVLGTVGCAASSAPSTPAGQVIHENDSTLWVLDGGLTPTTTGTTTFELGTLYELQAFDRVGARWDATLPAEARVELEVRTGATPDSLGEWQPVTVVSDEAGMFNGLADVAPGSTVLEARVVMWAPEISSVPSLTFGVLEVFEKLDETSATEQSGTPNPVVAAPMIMSREAWGANPPTCSLSNHTPYRATFHHTVTPNGESGNAAKNRVKNIQNYHQNVRGWCDIGYHLLVDDAGVLWRGRPSTGKRGAHVGGQNSGNVGVAFLGSFYDGPMPSAAQMDGAATAFAWIADYWGFAANGTNIRGHQEWPGQSTGCPGDILDNKTDLIATVQDIINGEVDPPPPPPDDPGDATVVVVDNNSPLFTASGGWGASTWNGQRYGADYRFRLTKSVSDLAKWSADLPTSGDWEVFVWYTAHESRTQTAPYFVYHNGGTTKVTVDQQTNGGEWVSLGVFSFDAGTAERVALSCWTLHNDYIIADAVKLEAQ